MRRVIFLVIIVALSLHAIKPLKDYVTTPDSVGIKYEEVSFKTKDDLNLAGWFLPAQDTSGNISKGKKPVIIITLADAGNISYMLWYYGNFFHSEEWHTFLFDWRGFGHSDPWPVLRDSTRKVMDLIYPEYIYDLHAAIDFIKKRPEVDSKRIGLFGRSMGAVIILSTVSQRDDIAAVMVDGAFTTMAEVLGKLSAVDDWGYRIPHGYPAELEPLWAAKKIKAAVFLVTGENDDRCTADMARRIYANLNAPKEIWIVPNSGHKIDNMPPIIATDEYRKRVYKFFSKFLKF
ncbi:TPA: alpha/beta fold hydrolase [Candidatus Bathyarchaeota archaeon]|nr:alpha/beta fold hydrolase [Candidatus Bathyarchaeota archaeon]